MKLVLITGATGLVGTHLVIELLRRGYHRPIIAIRGAESLSKLDYMLQRSGYSLLDVEPIAVDLSSIHDLREKLGNREIKTIYNCAAKVKIGGAAGEDLVNDNVEITHNICTLALEQRSHPLVVHVSSIAALGDGVVDTNTNRLTVDEQSVPLAVWSSSAYTRSKFYCEGEIWRAAAQGLPIAVVNPAVIIGHTPAQAHFWFPALRRIVGCGMPFWIDGMTGWVGAEDVARAMVSIAENHSLHGKRYLLCGENMSYRDLLRLTASTSGGFGPRIKIPKFILEILALLCPALKTVANQRTLYDGSAICRSLPEFKYTPISDVLSKI